MVNWLELVLIRFRLWLGDTIERCKDKNEIDRVGIIISVLVAWFVMSLAMQALLYYLVTWLADIPASKYDDLMNGLAPVSSVLAYAPILIFLPFIRDKIKGSPLLALPGTRSGTRSSRIWKTVGVGVGFSIIIFIGVQFMGGLVNLIVPVTKMSNTTRDASSNILGLMFGDSSWPVLSILDLLCAMVIAPLMEELMFRVVVASEVYSSTFSTKINVDGTREHTWMRTLMATLVSGFIFAAMHAMTTDPAQWLLVLMTTWLIGSVLSWMTCVWLKSAWPGVIAHVLYNVMVILLGVLVF